MAARYPPICVERCHRVVGRTPWIISSKGTVAPGPPPEASRSHIHEMSAEIIPRRWEPSTSRSNRLLAHNTAAPVVLPDPVVPPRLNTSSYLLPSVNIQQRLREPACAAAVPKSSYANVARRGKEQDYHFCPFGRGSGGNWSTHEELFRWYAFYSVAGLRDENPKA